MTGAQGKDRANTLILQRIRGNNDENKRKEAVFLADLHLLFFQDLWKVVFRELENFFNWLISKDENKLESIKKTI